jgi:hypothetical protein
VLVEYGKMLQKAGRKKEMQIEKMEIDPQKLRHKKRAREKKEKREQQPAEAATW